MSITSKTGLLASPVKKVPQTRRRKSVHLKAISVPAPVVLRPYAGLYNPFPYGCSLLCNHPTDKDARDVLKRARETWATENKNIILPEELQAIRESLACVEDSNKIPQIESVPEEMFRRYTETDSRPLTPAPTLASVKTRGSSSRRCVTPDPVITSVLRERTLLILDLRRSHSQEILSWHGSNDPPVINILQPPTPSISIDSPIETPNETSRQGTGTTRKSGSPKTSPTQSQKLEVPNIQPTTTNIIQENVSDCEASDGEEEIIKRKGRRRKKRGRDSSRGPLAVQASIDPETQISALGTESHNPSARPSLVPAGSLQDPGNLSHMHSFQNKSGSFGLNSISSVFEPAVLKHLQRELNEEIVDLEFDKLKRAALKEAFKSLPKEKKQPCDEMKQLQKELNLPQINAELWLSLPRVFSRSSARFELPLHSRTLNTIKPLEYLQQHCMVSNGRRLLYNLVFNRHRDYSREDETRLLCNERIPVALGEMMGRPLTGIQITRYRELVHWKNEDIIDFKTWCGMCALFERVFAVEFCAKLPNKEMDPCNDVEIADFQSLDRRLKHVTPVACLVKMLNAIKEL